MPGLRRGRPWYCFATHNATQKMTLADGTPLSPALGIGAFADRTLVAAGQCTKVDPAARPEAVGLLGCGVMAGIGAAMYTGEVGLGDSVAVFGCGGVGCAAIAGSKLAGAAVIIAVDLDRESSNWPRSSAPPTPSTPAPATRSRRSRAHRRQRGRRVHRGGGAPRGDGPGLPGPGPGGDAGAGGRADPRHAHRPADDRVLRAWWRAQAELVRRLPALTRLPDARSTSTSAAGSTSTASSARRSASIRSRTPSHACRRGEVLRSVVVL